MRTCDPAVTNPWPDAYIFVGTLAAMVAQARGLAFSGLVYVVYLVLVLWGMRDWWLRSRNSSPVMEGAAA